MWIVATLDGKMESEGKDVVFPLVLTPSGGGGGSSLDAFWGELS